MRRCDRVKGLPGGVSPGCFAVLAGPLLLSFCLSFCAASAERTNSDEDLKRGAEKFVAVVESRNSEALLNLFSEQGTSFISGTYALPKAEYSPTEIRKDFEKRTGVYCVFFDTTCLREEDAKERARQKARPIQIPLTSLIDLVTTAKIRKYETFDVSVKNGMVALVLTDVAPPKARTGRDAIVFYFRFEDGQMKLRNIEFE